MIAVGGVSNDGPGKTLIAEESIYPVHAVPGCGLLRICGVGITGPLRIEVYHHVVAPNNVCIARGNWALNEVVALDSGVAGIVDCIQRGVDAEVLIRELPQLIEESVDVGEVTAKRLLP